MKNYRSVAAILLTSILLSCDDSAEEKQALEPTVESPANKEETTEEPKTESVRPKKDTHVKLTNTEDKLIEQVWQLAEVKALSDKIERESKGKRHLTGRISSNPSDDQEYYGISISEDNGEALATYFEFRIYPDNSIYYYDVVEDRELSLKEWRAQKK